MRLNKTLGDRSATGTFGELYHQMSLFAIPHNLQKKRICNMKDTNTSSDFSFYKRMLADKYYVVRQAGVTACYEKAVEVPSLCSAVVRDLKPLLNDPSIAVRIQALTTIAKLDKEVATQYAPTILDHYSADMRAEAMKLLHSSKADGVTELLKARAEIEESIPVFKAIYNALKAHGYTLAQLDELCRSRGIVPFF